jgi:hypothetical protein
MREHTQLERRKLLAATGAVAGGSTAGCTSLLENGESNAQESPAQQQQQQSDGTTFDALEAGSIDAGAVSADELNSVVSVSPGDDLEAKVAAVPNGGNLFFEAGRHDVTEMGTVTANKVINIFMAGGTDGVTNPVGAVLENTGDDALDEPVITLTSDSPNPQDGARQWGSMLWNPTIVHHGDAPAIDVHIAPMSMIYKPEIQLDFKGRTGIGLTSFSQSWGLQIHGGRIRGPAEYGIEDRAFGGLKIIRGTQILHGNNNIGMRANRGWYIDATDFATGLGLQITGKKIVAQPRFEAVNKAIEIGPKSEMDKRDRTDYARCIIREPKLHGGPTESEFGIEFDQTKDSIVWNPTRATFHAQDAPLVRWTENAERCGFHAKYNVIERARWDIHENATLPLVDFVGTQKLDAERRNNIRQPVSGMSAWSVEREQPIYYDGDGWITPVFETVA